MLERRLLRCRDVLLSWKKPSVSREDERPKFDIQHRPLSYWRILREKERERERDTRNGGSRLSISLPTNPSSPTQYCIVLVNDFLFPIRSEQHLNQLPANKSRLRELITFDFRGNLAILLLFPIYSRMSCARSCVIK